MLVKESVIRWTVKLFVAALVAALLLEVIAPLAFGQGSRSRRVATNATTKQRAAKRQPAAKKKPLAPKIGPQELSEARRRLLELGYWVEMTSAKAGHDSFRYALVAFQKVEGLKPTGRLTMADLHALRAASRPRPRSTSGAHVEIDLERQVLFLVNERGEVERVLPVSSGNNKPFESEGWERDAITPIGRYFIQRKIAGWRQSPLGEMYYPNYILGGLAIHGSPSVPPYPASHGCIRIPMFAAEEFSRLTPIGMEVLIYDTEAPPQASPAASGK